MSTGRTPLGRLASYEGSAAAGFRVYVPSVSEEKFPGFLQLLSSSSVWNMALEASVRRSVVSELVAIYFINFARRFPET